MPLPENKGRTETVAAGGTSVASESNTSLWLGLGALVLVAGAVAFAAAGSDDKTNSTEPAAALPVDDTAEATAETPTSNTEGSDSDDSQVGFTGEEAPPTPEELRYQAVEALKGTLQAERLWSTVREEGEALSLVSGACSDPAMRPAIQSQASSLAAVGFTLIRCLEKHGEQVFEQSL